MAIARTLPAAARTRGDLPFFNLVLVYNRGAAFSFLAERRRLAALVLHRDRARGERRASCGCCAGTRGSALFCAGARADPRRRARQRLRPRDDSAQVVDFLHFHCARLGTGPRSTSPTRRSRVRRGAAHLRTASARSARESPPTAQRRARAIARCDPPEVLLAKPRGFCAGVDRAIEIVERALELHGAPIYVRHEVVHNKFVVDDLRAKGAMFVEELDEVPAGRHGDLLRARRVAGGARARPTRAASRSSTPPARWSPRCTSRSRKMRDAGPRDRDDRPRGPPRGRGHDGPVRRAACTWSRAPRTSRGSRCAIQRKLAYVTQTTLSIDDAAAHRRRAASARFPQIVGPKKDDICYATQNRQDAVKFLAPRCDVVIVVGSPNSSNSNRLREVAANRGVPAYMVDSADELDPEWVAGGSASASPPAPRRPRCWCAR